MANEKRLIDADALMDVIRQHEYRLATKQGSIDYGMFTLGIQQAVDEQPTIDAVPVVRCEKCALHGNCTTEDAFLLAGIEHPFCCAGKQKEGAGLMDVREKLVEILNRFVCDEWYSNDDIAKKLISNGVTVQEWIPVTERLPEENEYVMIWDGKLQIAKIDKGISKKERELMKNGEINDPVEIGWNASGGYRRLRRSELYRACDEGWNNHVPYCWYVNGGMMKLFGQNVTHWMPLPKPPKGE